MKFRQLNLCLGAGALAAMLAFGSFAEGSVIITDPGDRELRNNGLKNYTGSNGYVFTVNTEFDIQVTHLGIYDAPGNNDTPNSGTVGDGLEQSAHVAIYEIGAVTEETAGRHSFTNAGLIVGATVPAADGGSLLGDYRYVELLDEVFLEAGKTYQIVMGVNSGGNGFTNYEKGTDGPTIHEDFYIYPNVVHNGNGSYNNAAFATGGTSQGRAGSPYSGPNFQYVPEPASLVLLSAGGLMLLARGRRCVG